MNKLSYLDLVFQILKSRYECSSVRASLINATQALLGSIDTVDGQATVNYQTVTWFVGLIITSVTLNKAGKGERQSQL